MDVTEKPRLSDRAFAAFLSAETRSKVGLTTIGSDWSRLQVLLVEQGDDVFHAPPLDSHFLALCVDGLAVADVSFASLIGCGRTIFQPDTICFMPAGDASDVAAEGRIQMIHVLLRPTLVRDLIADKTRGDPDRVALPGFVGGRNDFIRSICLDILKEAGGAADALAADRLALKVASHLVGHVCDLAPADSAKRDLTPMQFSRAIDYIEANITTDFGLGEIAAYVGVDADRMAEGFERAVGYGLDLFRTERRISIAQDLASACLGKASSQDIAVRSGFGDVSGLDAAFRAHVGVSFENYRAGRLI
ncbi:AraC family transcriptional regulator [Sulfitobacter sp. D35]|uniref:helix-turn-helix domain-containing protein n=1 Tax=Sulfitobacter sp. D35 TaxID=3083252 RepID=UPI00296E9403|nr:AraC family transcriptional regulator [Sulfitobacter sp. D35]MDW4497863.1 AraC family transcriptional regulator [Sulfitobacter sp. D35]